MEFVFWVSLFVIYYVFDGYLRLLKIICFFKLNKKHTYNEYILPKVTVLLTVYNEEDAVIEKIEDILKQKYPLESLHILVASDGSNDKTEMLVLDYNNKNVSLFSPSKRLGKSDTQNKAIETIKDGLIIFTDCDTRFEKNCLSELVRPFEDSSIGCTTGHLLFINTLEGNIAQGQSSYWNYELNLRRLESQLNCLAVATGACMCIRKELFKPFEATYGEDCILPLDTIEEGSKVSHITTAIAYDKMPDTQRSEFNTRVRMTLRNWQGTWSRSELLNPFKYPKYSFSLWSHKLLRWLTPVFLIFLTISSAYLANSALFYYVAILGILTSYIIFVIGFFANKRGKLLPKYLRIIYSFILANLGFLVGLIKAISGKSIKHYTT